MGCRPARLSSHDSGSLVSERRAGARRADVQAPTCFPASPLPHPAAGPQGSRPHTHRRPALLALAFPEPSSRPGLARLTVGAPALPDYRSGLPDVGRLQRVQPCFIKAFHGVATRSRSSQADRVRRPLLIGSARSGSRSPRRKCRRAPSGGTQRAGVAHCGDASGDGRRCPRDLPVRAPRCAPLRGRPVVEEHPRRVA